MGLNVNKTKESKHIINTILKIKINLHFQIELKNPCINYTRVLIYFVKYILFSF